MSKLSLAEKTKKEKEILSLMIGFYYKGKQNSFSEKEFVELKQYCMDKVDNCPFMAEKTFCSSCSVHCYDDRHRQMIKKVMKYSAPRMLFYHPIMMIRHTLTSLKKS